MFDRRYNSSTLTAAVLATLYPSLSLGQQDQKDSGKLETIIVTATRRELNLQEVGQSITAFSTADIQRQGLQDVEDVIKALPSVSLVAYVPGRNSIFMRGISTGSAEYYVDSQISIYLDDQPLTSVSQQVDIWPIDIERIESLPGPQGTLFGSSSQSGTIRYISNKPDVDGYSSQLDLEVGTIKGGEETYDVSGHLNIPVSDNFAVRVVGFYSETGGWVDNVLGEDLAGTTDNSDVVEDDWNEYEAYGGRIAARWQISPKWESTLSLISQYSYTDGTWYSDPALGDYKTTNFFKEWRDDDWYQASLNVKGDLGFAELSMTASYFDRSIDYVWDDMTYDQWRTQYYDYAIYDTSYLIGQVYNWQTQRRKTYEVRLTSQGESRFQWMVGGFYEDVNDWWDYGKEIPGLMTTPAWTAANNYAYVARYYYGLDVQYPVAPTEIYYQNIFDKTIKQKAVFGEVTYDLTEKWSVTGGMRWFEYDREEVEESFVPQGVPAWDPRADIDPDTGEFIGAPVGGRIESSGKESDNVYKFGTQYKFDEDRMVYFIYSEGFRLGGNNAARAAATGLVETTYEPDKLENYEIGLKSTWLDDRLQVNIAAFLMEWKDFQLNVDTDIYWARGIFNGNDAEQQGIEGDFIWNVTPNLVLEGSVFLGDPEFTEETVLPSFDPEDPPEDQIDDVITAGTSLPLSPEQKYHAAVEYTIPSFLGWNGDLWTRLSYSYQSETWKDLDAAIERDALQNIPSWWTSDLQIGFTHNNGWDATLIVRNLTDENGINWLGATDWGTTFNDPRFNYFRTLQQPRTISLAFSKKW